MKLLRLLRYCKPKAAVDWGYGWEICQGRTVKWLEIVIQLICHRLPRMTNILLGVAWIFFFRLSKRKHRDIKQYYRGYSNTETSLLICHTATCCDVTPCQGRFGGKEIPSLSSLTKRFVLNSIAHVRFVNILAWYQSFLLNFSSLFSSRSYFLGNNTGAVLVFQKS